MRTAGVATGEGIFAKTAKTPPLQSGFCGDAIATYQPYGVRIRARYAPQLPYAISIAELPIPRAFTILIPSPYHRRTRAA